MKTQAFLAVGLCLTVCLTGCSGRRSGKDGEVLSATSIRQEEVEPLPLGAIVTVAGTGSEYNGSAVITNESKNQNGSGLSKTESQVCPDGSYPYLQRTGKTDDVWRVQYAQSYYGDLFQRAQ